MGKHSKKRAKRVAMGASAVGVAASVAGIAATHPQSISAPLVDLTALIVVGSSTHPDGSGNENFFGGKFNGPPYIQEDDDLVHINFFQGPWGINQALEANPSEPDAVLASGWGAANASLLLTYLQARNDPSLADTVWIFDNHVSRADGGFGTRYPWFAFLGVNPIPTPTDDDPDAPAVVDIAYQYNYNSNAPADLLNGVAHVNSLVAYLYGYLGQDQVDLPVDVDGTPTVDCEGANTCAITANEDVIPCPDARCAEEVPPEDRIVAYVTTKGNTTYVTYTTDRLPLLRPVRDFVPFGDVIADATEPLLKVAVDSAYPDNNPIPDDPSEYTPARLVAPPAELAAAAQRVPGAIQEGLRAATDGSSTLRSTDEESPSLVSPVREPKALRNLVRESDKAVPGSAASDRPSDRATGPVRTAVKSVIDNLNKTVRKVTGGFGEKSDESADGADGGES